MTDSTSMADWLRYWRLYRGLTQRDLANIVEIAVSVITSLETGSRPFLPRYYEKLAAGLKLPLVVFETPPTQLSPFQQYVLGTGRVYRMAFNDVLVSACKRNKIRFWRLPKVSGISSGQLKAMRKGTMLPTPKTVKRLSSVLNKDLDFFYWNYYG